MFPSQANRRYGIFVKRFEDIVKKDFLVEKIVLGKQESVFLKLVGYLRLYLKTAFLFFRLGKEDIIYIHFPLYFSPFLALLCAKGAPVYINFHGSDAVFDTPLKKILAIFLKRSINRCYKVVVPSQYYQDRIVSIFDISVDKLHINPSGGIDGSIFYPMDKAEDHFIFGFVSNFIPKKGWDIFLEALAILKSSASTKSFKAIMVGDGPDYPAIKKRINDADFDVEIIKSVEQTKLAGIYARFDVFVFPTYRVEESLGLVGLEALMCGIPVIATKMAGPEGYIIDGYNGYFFERQNSMDLADKMIKYTRLTELEIKSMKQNAIESVQSFEKQLVQKELLKLLKEC